MNHQSDIAILLFSRTARQESESKNWLAGQDQSTNESLAKALITKTREVLTNTNLPVVQFNEQHQVGDTFGERLANAFDEVFAQGYKSVICVGNDCLQLRRVDFTEIAIDLSAGKNVVGPDFRSGAYLIALRKEDFHKGIFAHLSWQTDDLFDDLIDHLENVKVLPKLRDFNDSRDLYLLKKESSWLRRLLRRLITFDFTYNPDHPGWEDNPGTSLGRRGPPSL